MSERTDVIGIYKHMRRYVTSRRCGKHGSVSHGGSGLESPPAAVHRSWRWQPGVSELNLGWTASVSLASSAASAVSSAAPCFFPLTAANQANWAPSRLSDFHVQQKRGVKTNKCSRDCSRLCTEPVSTSYRRLTRRNLPDGGRFFFFFAGVKPSDRLKAKEKKTRNWAGRWRHGTSAVACDCFRVDPRVSQATRESAHTSCFRNTLPKMRPLTDEETKTMFEKLSK